MVVLGIDCFSRAGLKEFWAYIWNLNDNLFPVGATTYPLTRGIRVEIAAIIVIFLAGILSQMKVWKIIKTRREQRAAERLEDERTMEQYEENVGRRIEQQNAQERAREDIYAIKNSRYPTGSQTMIPGWATSKVRKWDQLARLHHCDGLAMMKSKGWTFLYHIDNRSCQTASG